MTAVKDGLKNHFRFLCRCHYLSHFRRWFRQSWCLPIRLRLFCRCLHRFLNWHHLFGCLLPFLLRHFRLIRID